MNTFLSYNDIVENEPKASVLFFVRWPMKQVLKDMIKIYKPKSVDWLGFKITKDNPYSYHHCFKKVYGEYQDLDPNYLLNIGAILSLEGQAYIHSFESVDYNSYNELNRILLELNETRKPPDERHWQKVRMFKTRHEKE